MWEVAYADLKDLEGDIFARVEAVDSRQGN
jgi:hypothetical protein